MSEDFEKLKKEISDFQKECAEHAVGSMPRISASFVANKLESILKLFDEGGELNGTSS